MITVIPLIKTVIGAAVAPVAGVPDSGPPPPRYASWYGEELRGRLMANGRPFNPDAHTCASWFFPFGTRLQVSHKGKKTVVTVTDRGPAKRLVARGRIIDLSHSAFKDLADPNVGVIPITIRKLR